MGSSLLTEPNTASNALFGSLQRISPERFGFSPILMGAADSLGGITGKLIDTQSNVPAAAATNYHGQQGLI
jgi:lactate permease